METFFYCRDVAGNVLRFTDATHAAAVPIGATIFASELTAQACLLAAGYGTSAEVHPCRCETGTTATSVMELRDTETDVLVGVRKKMKARKGGKGNMTKTSPTVQEVDASAEAGAEPATLCDEQARQEAHQ